MSNNCAVELILKNKNFEIRNTEKIAVVGRNGCVKTTLLKLISGEVDLVKRDSDENVYISADAFETSVCRVKTKRKLLF